MVRHSFRLLTALLLVAASAQSGWAQEDATDAATVTADQSAETAAAETAAAETAAAEATTTAEAEKKPADPSGTWRWERDFNGQTMEFELKLNWDGEKLTGEYTSFDQSTPIEEAKNESDGFSFIVEREFNGNEFEIFFDGEVKDDTISGITEIDFGGGVQEFDWDATRHVDVDDVLGTWNLTLENPNGDPIEPTITITKNGEELAGSYESVFGERDAKNVKIDGTKLTWEISGENNGNTFKAVYTGKVRGNKIAGTNEFDFGGNAGTWKFTGEREPADNDKATDDNAATDDAPADDAPAQENEP
jgi:hypothetical protein